MLAGALGAKRVSHLETMKLALNGILVVEKVAFAELPKPKNLWIYGNRGYSGAGRFFPVAEAFVFSTETGVLTLEAGAFGNSSMISNLILGYNSFAAVTTLDGIFTDLYSLQRLGLGKAK